MTLDGSPSVPPTCLLLGCCSIHFLVCVCDYINEPSPHRHRLTKSEKSSAGGNGAYRSLFPPSFFKKIQFQISRYFLFFFAVCLLFPGVLSRSPTASASHQRVPVIVLCPCCAVCLISCYQCLCAGIAAAAAQREKIAKSIGNYFSSECAVRNARYRTTAGPPFHHHQIKTHQVTNTQKKRKKFTNDTSVSLVCKNKIR